MRELFELLTMKIAQNFLKNAINTIKYPQKVCENRRFIGAKIVVFLIEFLQIKHVKRQFNHCLSAEAHTYTQIEPIIFWSSILQSKGSEGVQERFQRKSTRPRERRETSLESIWQSFGSSQLSSSLASDAEEILAGERQFLRKKKSN